MASINVDLDGETVGFAMAADPRELACLFGALVDEMDVDGDDMATLCSALKGEDSDTRRRLLAFFNLLVKAIEQ